MILVRLIMLDLIIQKFIKLFNWTKKTKKRLDRADIVRDVAYEIAGHLFPLLN